MTPEFSEALKVALSFSQGTVQAKSKVMPQKALRTHSLPAEGNSFH